jgi:hypothetical protein
MSIRLKSGVKYLRKKRDTYGRRKTGDGMRTRMSLGQPSPRSYAPLPFPLLPLCAILRLTNECHKTITGAFYSNGCLDCYFLAVWISVQEMSGILTDPVCVTAFFFPSSLPSQSMSQAINPVDPSVRLQPPEHPPGATTCPPCPPP